MRADKPQVVQASKKSENDAIRATEETGSKGPARSRASRDRTRGSVAFMSAERLARKRAADREAQRVIRQRQKNYIASLEERIRELSKAQQSDKSLSEEQWKTSELEAELRFLREQSYGSGDGANTPQFMSSTSGYKEADMGEQNTISYLASSESQYDFTGPTLSAPTSAPPGTANTDNFGSSQVSDTLSAKSELGYEPYVVGNERSHFFGTDFGMIERPDAVGNINPAPAAHDGSLYTQSPVDLSGSTSFHSRRSENMWRLTALQASPLATNENITSLDSSPMTTRFMSLASKIPSSFVNQPSLRVWELPLQFAPPKDLLENIIINVIQHQKYLAVGGTRGTALIGPSKISLKPLLCPEPSTSTHPVLFTLSGLLRAFTHRGLPEKVGYLIIMYPVFQWLISPTLETYNNLPEYYTPLAAQVVTPHPAWIACISWPKLRDIVIANQERYATDEFKLLIITSSNVNWPYRSEDTFFTVEGDMRVSEAFMKHARRLENWSLDEPFQSRYPELKDFCKFTEDRVVIRDLDASNQ